jgi:glycosyltransferase involved in cell wall biosynthesis
VSSSGDGLRVFYAFRDSPLRRAALAAPPGAPERYCLHGLDQVAARRAEVRHNLERRPPAGWARVMDAAVNRIVYGAGGYGGDFASVVASLRALNGADVVLSTVDTLGLPLALLKRAGLVRPPLVYIAIGLPERLAKIERERVRRLYASALGTAATIVAFSRREAAAIDGWLREHGASTPIVEFVPFGVDTAYFRPQPQVAPEVDVVSIGADPHRDFSLLLRVAERVGERSFRLVVSAEHARALGRAPANVSVEVDLPFALVRDCLASGRLVVLPVKENSYSGATTVLLQALATGRPVVVSRTEAIADGYGLADGVNCRLVPPGDEGALEDAVRTLLDDGETAARIGAAARATAERSLSWERYVDALYGFLARAAGPGPRGPDPASREAAG